MSGYFAGYAADGPLRGNYIARERHTFELALEPNQPHLSMPLDPRPVPMHIANKTMTYWFTVDGEWRVRR